MLHRLIVLILFAAIAPMARGQYLEAVEARLESGSVIAIDGTSTVNSFTCRASDVEGRASLPSAAGSTKEVDVVIVVPVTGFDCGKRRMNADMQKAMRADEFPAIRFELDRAELLGSRGENEHRLAVHGYLFIAGEQRPVSMAVVGRPGSDGRMHLVGRASMLMSDFGIDPPSALLGMVQAHDQIVVRFDLEARLVGQKRLAQNVSSGSRP